MFRKWALRRGEGGEEERDPKAKTQLRGELLRSTLLFARLLYNMKKKGEGETEWVCVNQSFCSHQHSL